MKYFELYPEVAGGFGENTVLDRSAHPPAVKRFHYEFHGWMGDDIVTTVGNFIVTQSLWTDILASKLAGVTASDVEISINQEYVELFEEPLPEFIWMKVTGGARESDFGISEHHKLVVSERALRVLQSHSLRHCELSEV